MREFASQFTCQFAVPRWAIMWGLAIFFYSLAKVYTWARRAPLDAPRWKQAGYLLAWPGMDVENFLHGPRPPKPSLAEWGFAVLKPCVATLVLYGVCPRLHEAGDVVFGWLGLVCIIFILHFGLFHLLSCAWRAARVPAPPIMNWPIAARSLCEFWSQRWNLAFNDLATRLVFRPCSRRVGAAGALVASFVISGLIHDLVISAPAGAGYGLPALYFALQAAGILFERSRLGVALGLGHGARGWLFAFALLVIPSPLLFHPWFIHRVAVPFLHAIGA